MAIKIGNRIYPDVGGAEYERLAGAGMAARGGPTTPSGSPVVPVRGQSTLNRAIQGADSDEDLKRLKKLLDDRGIDTSLIPAFQGLPE